MRLRHSILIALLAALGTAVLGCSSGPAAGPPRPEGTGAGEATTTGPDVQAALFKQLAHGDAGVFAAWLGEHADADVNAQNEDGHAPLHLCPNRAVAEVLVAHGALINAVSGRGHTPIHSALMRKAWDVAAYLLEKEVDIRVRDPHGRTPLFYAAAATRTDMLAVMFERDAAIDLRDIDERTPLHMTCAEGSTPDSASAAAMLLARGADLRAADTSGATPLHLAAKNEKVACVRLLLKSGAEVDVRDVTGWTPLHCAAAFGASDAACT